MVDIPGSIVSPTLGHPGSAVISPRWESLLRAKPSRGLGWIKAPDVRDADYPMRINRDAPSSANRGCSAPLISNIGPDCVAQRGCGAAAA